MGRHKKNKNLREDNLEESLEERKPRRNLKGDAKRSAVAVVLFALAALSVLGFFGLAGSFGGFLNRMIAYSIGWVKFILPVFLIIAGVVLLIRRETAFYITKFIGLAVALLSFTGIFHWFYASKEMLKIAGEGKGGGYVGYALSYFLEKYLGSAGSMVVLLALFFLGIIVAFNFSIIHLFSRLKKEETEEESGEENKEEKTEEKKPEEKAQETLLKLPLEEKKSEEMEAEKNIGRIEFAEGRDQFVSPQIENQIQPEMEINSKKIMERRSLDMESPAKEFKFPKASKGSKWSFPPADMLEKSYGTAQGGDIESNFAIIEKTLKDFGIQVERGAAKIGPAVTQYSFRPAVGVKIAKILALQNDLSLALAAHPIRIEAPIPGQSLIGIEIPNKSSLIVRLRDMIEDTQFRKRTSNLTLTLGQDVSGSSILGDLAKMPHLMIAGSTGTGKSVSINSIILTLLYQNSPEDLKFIMIDPKRVELSLYNGIPHLLADVVVDNGKVINALKWAVGEMERRYRLLQDVGSRDINSYREKYKSGYKIKRTDLETKETYEEELKNLPYIIIVIDELADLMISSHGKEVESAIVRIAQMARAVGIHLIISTQRPSVEVITGLIKANIATRIAFQVATQIDSRTILDMGGAEKLLGNGDMLYLSTSSPKPKRIQGVFVSESEVKRVVKFVKAQKKEDKKENEEGADITENSQKEITEFKAQEENGEDEELIKKIEEEIIRAKKASASFLQRRFRIGYARAARILDVLEEKGIIGPADGAKPREVYGASPEENIGYEDKLEDQEKRDKWEL
ncbi:MAG TPA: DNA translocase FtsK 4TM domain-containing protein [Candidatus Moranbacteria bacterium]|nr:DNA translocase FtsK 4TM domain-containing protein [Candidatus Moranbacteria bacterium]